MGLAALETLPHLELADEFRLVGRLHPQARIDLLVRLLEWTIDALPSKPRSRLRGKRRRTVDAAMKMVRDAAAGSSEFDRDEVASLMERLWDLADDVEVLELGQLFVALAGVAGVSAEDLTPEALIGTMSECYDVIRDCEDLPEFPVGTPESIVLDQERANANCMRAIEFQKRLVHETVQQQQ
ncbi:MAG TPA: hypothetical protein VF062_13925 [Candidatus Limnocylindrales bacterium]